jgi:hypothetical protein
MTDNDDDDEDEDMEDYESATEDEGIVYDDDVDPISSPSTASPSPSPSLPLSPILPRIHPRHRLLQRRHTSRRPRIPRFPPIFPMSTHTHVPFVSPLRNRISTAAPAMLMSFFPHHWEIGIHMADHVYEMRKQSEVTVGNWRRCGGLRRRWGLAV